MKGIILSKNFYRICVKDVLLKDKQILRFQSFTLFMFATQKPSTFRLDENHFRWNDFSFACLFPFLSIQIKSQLLSYENLIKNPFQTVPFFMFSLSSVIFKRRHKFGHLRWKLKCLAFSSQRLTIFFFTKHLYQYINSGRKNVHISNNCHILLCYSCDKSLNLVLY